MATGQRYGNAAVIEAFLAQARIPLLREVWEALAPLEEVGLVLNWQAFGYNEGVGQGFPMLTLSLAYRPEAWEYVARKMEAARATVASGDGHGGHSEANEL